MSLPFRLRLVHFLPTMEVAFVPNRGNVLVEPFTLQCPTCQSHIRVKNAKMIGQVANCPKCNSMVMITAPQQVRIENPDGFPVDSMAMTKDGLEPNFALQSVSEAVLSDGDYQLMPLEKAEVQKASETQLPAGWQPQEPLLPSDEWTSETSTKTRQFLLIGFLGLTGVALAILSFLAFLNWYRKPGQSPDPGPPLALASTLGPEVPEPDVAVGPEQTSVADSGSADREAEGPTSSQSDPSSQLEQKDEPENAAQLLPNAIDTQPLQVLPNELQGDVLIDPGVHSVDASDSTPAVSTEPESEQTAEQSLPNAWLQSMAPVLDWQVVPTLPDNRVPLEPPPITAEDLGMSTLEGLEPITPIDWGKQSQIVLPGLILSQEQSLSQSLNLWTHVSGVPTRVNLDSLAAINFDCNGPLTIGTIKQASIGQIAQRIAENLGITVSARENRYLEFHATEEKLAATLPKTMSVEGLIATEEEAQWLLQMLVRFFPDTDQAWSLEDRHLKYQDNRVDLMTWFEVIRLIDNLQTANGQPSTLTEYAAGRLQNSFIEPEKLVSLNAQVNLISPQARPVGQVLSRLCGQMGLQCWIDWPSVGEVGLGPATTAVVVTHGRSLKRILANYANMFSLQIAVQDENNLWITSPQAYRKQARIYVLPSEGLTPEQWQQRLLLWTPLKDDGTGEVIAVLTPQRDKIVVRCCRPAISF